jgi:hypothetical protein
MPHARLIAVPIALAAFLVIAQAWADEPSTTAPPKADASQTKPADTAQAKQIAAAKKADASKTAANAAKKDRRDCLTSTGSRIPARPGECLNEPGHSFGHDDIDRTGATTAGGALRLMDPTLR